MTWRNCLLLTAALSATLPAGCSRTQGDDGPKLKAVPVLEIAKVAPVQRSEITESLELVGTLYPWRFATIVSEVDGVIASLPTHDEEIKAEYQGREFSMPIFLDIGHEVKEDSVLVEIDKRPFQLELDAANARLDVATKELADLLAWKREEEVAQLEADAEEADAREKRAKLDLDRYEELYKKKKDAVSESAHDAIRAAHKTAVAAKKRADAAVRLARAGPTPEQIAVGKAQLALAESEVALREEDLKKCAIYCPYDAVIVDRYVGVGDRVTAMPRVEIMQIIDPSILLAQVSVPEKYQRLVKVNDLATVQAPGISEPVPGLVALVNQKIDPETRTFRARVGVENPQIDPNSAASPRRFKSGSYVRVRLSLASEPDTLVVPAEAMTFEAGQPAVFVFCDDHVEKHSVTLGMSNGTQYEIREGLSEGERVVVGGTALLADGLPVRLKGSDASVARVDRQAPPSAPEPAGDDEPRLSKASESGRAEP